jgi:hypothetical protein
MKFVIILTTVLALPGNSWSLPAIELEHTAESRVNSAIHSVLNDKINLPAMSINRLDVLKEVDGTVKTIKIYKNVGLPLNQMEAEIWANIFIPHFKESQAQKVSSCSNCSRIFQLG